MSSSVRVDGALPRLGAPTRGIVFSGPWGVEYDWSIPDRAPGSGQPARLLARSFPLGFESDLEGTLRGQAAFDGNLYLFRGGQYFRLLEATMAPNSVSIPTATAWTLPASWTALDAVFPGGGVKRGFAYFFRADEYARFDWSKNEVSPGYPKKIALELHTTGPFVRDIDGVIIGQDSFSTKAYLFKRIPGTVDEDGIQVPPGTPGSFSVTYPAYCRYDFDARVTDFSVTDPVQVLSAWRGLFPLLDAGPAIDTALGWCDAALVGLRAGTVATALGHHFMNISPNDAQLEAIVGRMIAIRNRINTLPDRFQWTPDLAVAAQTIPNTLTEIGDQFSLIHGPNGRAAVLIHEAVHFTFTGGIIIDVPEFSGATTMDGVTHPVIGGQAYSSLTTDEAIANPSSYAAFAQEVALHGDTRFGAGRRQL